MAAKVFCSSHITPSLEYKKILNNPQIIFFYRFIFLWLIQPDLSVLRVLLYSIGPV